MKRYNTIFTTAFVATLLCATVAQAGAIKVVQVPNPGTGALAGTTTNDILIDAGPTEQIGAIQIYANLTEGSFYQDAFGGNTPPNPAFFVAFPAVEYDSFVASGFPTNERVPGVLAASVDLGSPNSGGAAVFSATTIDATYGPEAGQNTLGALDFLAARLTIGSEGIFRMTVEFSGGGPNATIMDGLIQNGIVSLGGVVDLFPNIDVLGNAMSIANGDLTPSLDDNTDFGNVLLGSIQNRVFSITNTGDADLVLDGLNISGDFSLVGAFPGTLGPSATEIFTLAMDTSVLGAKSGAVSFGTNVLDLATFSFDLAGNVVPEPTSLSLLGLALIGMVGLARRRS